MSREILKHIIDNFLPEDFIDFFRTKNRSFKPHAEQADEYNDNDFKDALSIGHIPFHQTENLIVYSFRATKNLSERSGKKLQYEKGKKILKDTQADAGIFIFYDINNDFRFSLIYPEYAGTRRQWSSFKRFTYFVSPELINKTFLQRIGDGDFSSIDAIKEAFSVEKVTREFYSEIANWYFWALKEAKFPSDAEAEPNGRNIALIRLITRIIFIWFMRQKGIVKKELFDRESLKGILKDLSDKEDAYYKAFLQDLFFATLNTPIEQRKFRREQRYKGYLNKDYMNHTYFRHHSLFKDPDRMKEFFNDIPFLNGGLFECLDKRKDDESNDSGREIRIDGFSDDPKKQPSVPNILFFSEEREIDLNEDYGTKNKRYKAKGLINILKSYNFTIDENTPVDEEIALDPELLGRVFENLLASYNPETATTARKATGSYYTPREIVDYMVMESLKEYFKVKVPNIDEDSLNQLFLYDEDKNPFDNKTTEQLIDAIHNLKLIDPAVGSGAFPMGFLHALVHILHKLDPHNEKWKEQQIKAVQHILDPQLKQETLKRIEESFTLNELDYGRKLYLIQNCIYGVDIQPIAIQIAKLRFFISLLVDERVDKAKPNYGIEPLPNLETKFVAANTLIGLPRPSQLSLQTPAVKRLEDELKEIRNQYFIASSIREKEKLKKKDAEIRKALAKSLASSGWESDATEKIARWNPYDTNKSADWFEPEWMFGITEGFDVVIANPPYGADLKAIEKDLLDRKYNKLKTANKNSAIYFIYLSNDLLSVGGINSFIVPKSLCYSNGWNKCANFISTHLKKLIDVGKAFENVKLEQVIYICPKLYSSDVFINGLYEDTMIKEFTPVNKSIFNNYGVLLAGQTQEEINLILSLIGKHTYKWGDYVKIERGLNWQSLVSKNPGKVPIYRGAHLNKYYLAEPTDFIDLSRFNTKDYKYQLNPKILNQLAIAHVQNPYPHFFLQAVLDLDNKLVFETISCTFAKTDTVSLKFLLALNNSKLFAWLLYKFVYSNAIRSTRYDEDYIIKIPCPKLETIKQQPFITLVDQILAAKKKDPNADTSALEHEIDEMVYALYGLTPEEIEIVEGKKN